MILSLFKGRVGLPRTFWIFGVAIWISMTIGLPRCFDLALSLSRIDPVTAILGILAAYLAYTFSISMAIWKSATHYNGKKIWSVLAKGYAALMYGMFLWPALSHVIPLSLNPNTAVVINTLYPTPRMPWVGFWKVKSYEQFGVAIADAGNGLYSVSFCGPGGCFEPGEWTPNTTIVNDPCYRIIDENTLEFVGRNDSTIYKRFTKGPSNQPLKPIR